MRVVSQSRSIRHVSRTITRLSRDYCCEINSTHSRGHFLDDWQKGFVFLRAALNCGNYCGCPGGCCHVHWVQATQVIYFQLVDEPHWYVVFTMTLWPFETNHLCAYSSWPWQFRLTHVFPARCAHGTKTTKITAHRRHDPIELEITHAYSLSTLKPGRSLRPDVTITCIAITRGVALPVRIASAHCHLLGAVDVARTHTRGATLAPATATHRAAMPPPSKRRKAAGEQNRCGGKFGCGATAEVPTERHQRLAATDVAAGMDGTEFNAHWFDGDSDAEADDQVGTHRAGAARRACHAGERACWQCCGAAPGPRSTSHPMRPPAQLTCPPALRRRAAAPLPVVR